MASLVILAAGMGSRYGGPKQVDPMGPHGQIILDYTVFDALKSGFDRLVFVIREEMEDEFAKWTRGRYDLKAPCVFVHQRLEDLPEGFSVPPDREKPWGTGHAVLACRDAVAEPFCVVNADDFYGREAYHLMATFLNTVQSPDEFAMVGYRLGNTLSPHGTVSRGVCLADENQSLVSVTEKTGVEPCGDGRVHCNGDQGETEYLSREQIVSLNFWGFTPAFFSSLEDLFREFLEAKGSNPKAEFYLPFAVDALIQGGRATVSVLESTETWVGVTYREDRERVADHISGLVREGMYPEILFERAVS